MTDNPLKIEKGIPMPTTFETGRPRGEFSECLRAMGIGDSVLIHGKSAKDTSSHARGIAKRIGGGVAYATRKEGDGIRVWRIK